MKLYPGSFPEKQTTVRSYGHDKMGGFPKTAIRRENKYRSLEREKVQSDLFDMGVVNEYP